MKSFLIRVFMAVLGNILASLYSYFLGMKNEENKNNSKIISKVEKATTVRNRLKRDPDYAAKLRKKFSR